MIGALLLSEVLSLQALAQISTGAYSGVATGSEATTTGSGAGQNYLTLGTMTARTAPAIPTVGAVTTPSTVGTTGVVANHATVTPGTMGTTMAAVILNGSTIANNQVLSNGAVTIAQVISNGPGWVVIHDDMKGNLVGAVGWDLVLPGTSNNIRANIDPCLATYTHHIEPHRDNRTIGVFDFPSPDTEVMNGNMPIMATFQATGNLGAFAAPPRGSPPASTVAVTSISQASTTTTPPGDLPPRATNAADTTTAGSTGITGTAGTTCTTKSVYGTGTGIGPYGTTGSSNFTNSRLASDIASSSSVASAVDRRMNPP